MTKEKKTTKPFRKGQPLENWDISFFMNGEVLVNILSYVNMLDYEIPTFFYKDKIRIQCIDTTKVSYTRIDIPNDNLLEYKICDKNDEKPNDDVPLSVIIDGRIISEIAPFVGKDNYVEVKIDTKHRRSIQLTVLGLTVITRLIAEQKNKGGIERFNKMDSIIKSFETVPGKVSYVVGTQVLNNICNLGATKSDKKGGNHITVSSNGQVLTVTSSSDLTDRILKVDQSVEYQEMNKGSDMSEGITEEDNVDGEFDNTTDETIEDFPGLEDTVLQVTTESDVQQEVETSVMLDRDYLEPLLKLKGLGALILELIRDRPLQVHYTPYNNIKVFLMVSPRLETDD